MNDLETPPVPAGLQLIPEHATITAVLEERARLHPDDAAFIFLGDGEKSPHELSYQTLARSARRIANRLLDEGCRGHRVLMFYPSGLEFITAFFGCLYAGVIPVPAYPPRKNRSLHRIRAIVAGCGAEAILTTASVAESLARNFAEDPQLNLLRWHVTEPWTETGSDHLPAPGPGFRELAFLQYTSGSTGDPKGVMVSHRNIMFNLKSLELFFGITRRDVIVNWVPQFHDLGLVFGILETVFSGTRTILIPPVTIISKPILLFNAITRYRATITGQPDFAFNLCVDKTSDDERRHLDLSSIRIVYSGAEPVRKATFERFLAVFSRYGLKPEALFPGYGMAESTLVLTCGKAGMPPHYLPVSAVRLEQNQVEKTGPFAPDLRWITSNGRPCIDTRILIVNPESREILDPGNIGEIWASGSTITLGYYGQLELTGTVFCQSPAGRDEPIWLRTGDLGFLDDGKLYITGRLKDLIIIHGRNLYPQDVEAAVGDCHSSIRNGSVAAFSVEQDGEERLAIVAELKRSVLPHDTERILAAIAGAVSGEFEVQPARIVLIRSGRLLKTSSGKIMRRAIRDSLLAGTQETLADRSYRKADDLDAEGYGGEITDLGQFLVSWISHHLNEGRPVDPAESLSVYGIDSLRAVELTEETKTRFGFEWPPSLFFEEMPISRLAEEGKKLMVQE